MNIGEEIMDFSFEAYYKDEIKKMRISDFKGKWLVLAFYPADFTFVCPTELEELADKHDDFKKLGAEVISFSTDTAFVHKAWHDQSASIKKINYPMGADTNGVICRALGTYIEEEGTSLRATFIIDPDGILKSVEIHDNSIGRSANEIFRKLQAAKHVRDNPGTVCPASWEPGKKTLKPSIDLVGKI